MSRFAAKVLAWYKSGVWTEQMVRDAHAKGRITAEELDEILSV